MTQSQQRPSILIRWFRRCPYCGAWGKLRITQTTKGLDGQHRNYVCQVCHADIKDWKPSEQVKFGSSGKCVCTEWVSMFLTYLVA